MDQRTGFIADQRQGLSPVTELCARYGLSRKTGYQWLDRLAEHGRRGLADRSRAPHHCPHRMAVDLADLLCATRRTHPDWERASSWTISSPGIRTSTGRRPAP